MRASRSLRYFLVCGVVLALAACGFRLAGTAQLAPSLESIHLDAGEMTDSQRTRLVKRLEQAGARIIPAPDAGAPRLAVRLKTIPDRTMVNSASTGKTVRRLARALDYRVIAASGEVLVENTTLTQQQDITLDEDNLLASNQERDDLIRDLELGLYNQLVRRLQRL